MMENKKMADQLVSQYQKHFEAIETDGVHDYATYFPKNKARIEACNKIAKEILESYPAAYNRIVTCTF